MIKPWIATKHLKYRKYENSDSGAINFRCEERNCQTYLTHIYVVIENGLNMNYYCHLHGERRIAGNDC